MGCPRSEEMLELITGRTNANITSLRYHFVPMELAPKVEVWGEREEIEFSLESRE